jgi:hypothetical protein
MTSRLGTVLLALAATGACASSGSDAAPPAPETVKPVRISGSRGGIGSTEIRNEPRVVARTVAAPVDSVWRVLPHVYEVLGISEAGIDPEQKVFGNPGFRPRRIEGQRLSGYIECGTGVTAVPKADEYEVAMSVLTRLSPGDAGGTVIATTVEATGKPRSVSGNPVYCQSKGTLEARVAELVLRVLRGER